MPDKDGRVRYAVVGAGQIAQQAFIPGLSQSSNSVLAAIVTGDADKGRLLSERHGVPAHLYDDFAALCTSDTIDAFYIATPNFDHRRFAVPALEAGKHVLLEKAMEVSVENCEAIIAAKRRGGGRLMIAYRLHCEPGTVDLVALCRRGDLGALRMVSSTFGQSVSAENHRTKNGYWAGPVPDMGTYPLNAARNIFGAEPIEVMARGVRTPDAALECDDTVAVTLIFEGQRVAQFTVSYASAGVDSLTVVGDRGSAHVQPAFMFGAGTGIAFETTIDGRVSRHDHAPVEQFGGEADYFSNCILREIEPEPNGHEGLADVRVLAAIERALETGEVQKLEPRRGPRGPSVDMVRKLSPARVPRDADLIGVKPL